MIRKTVSTLLVVCLIAHFASCYSSKTEMVYDLSAGLPQHESVTVHMKDGSVQEYKSGGIVEERFIGIDDAGKAEEIFLEDILYFELETKELSTGMTVLAGVGTVLAAVVVTTLIVIAVASCPHVSVFDGESWVLEAEPNGGAITRSTEYTDYSVMRYTSPAEDGTYRMRLENNLEEIDFDNELKLLAVEHSPGARVIPDVNGSLLAVSNVARPAYAMTDGGVDLLEEYGVDGRLFWDGDRHKTDYDEKHPRDELYLKFERPAGARTGVLVFEGSSTYWSKYIMADFLSKFGRSAAARFARLENDPLGREKVERFMKKSGYYIDVQIEHNGEWIDAGCFKTAGTYVSKLQALQIDFPESAGDTVEIKLTYAPFFWNIMEIGMGYRAEHENFRVTELTPVEAIDTGRGDIRELLLARDDLYYRAVQGDRADITFHVPAACRDMEQTLILKTSGYYNFILDEDKEMPFLSKVWQAVKRQGIDGYSLEKYREIREQVEF